MAKFEGHSSDVRMANFAYPSAEDLSDRQYKRYGFVSCARSECLLWEVAAKEVLAENLSSGSLKEIV